VTDQWVNDKGEGVKFGGGVEGLGDDAMNYRNLDTISELGWQAHKAWERIIGEQPKQDWRDLSDEQKESVRYGVRWLIEHPTSSLAVQHDAWRARTVGKGEDHDNLIPFDELPFSQQMKARLWRHIIFAVLG
jgi:hypothetical protein